MPDPMSAEELKAFRKNAAERVGGELWSLLDWSFWGAGMADVFREPLADTMLAAVPDNARQQAEAIMADFIKRRGIEKTGVTVYQEQRAEVDRLKAERERDVLELIDERDNLEALLNRFADAIAPAEVIGEHSSANDPWLNALELITSAAEVDRLKAENTRLANRVAAAEDVMSGALEETERAEVARWLRGYFEAVDG